MKNVSEIIQDFANLAWGTPMLILLLGGGLFFLFYSSLQPLKYIKHAIQVLLGKYDNPNEPGQISHYQALSTALAATVGMGNVSGVALAIATGGPGAIFWMWISAILGVSTKFFTCTLSVMYRGKDSLGEVQGGPMYVITEGLGKHWKPLAIFFCIAGMIGVSHIFQVNQITQVIRDVVLIPNGIEASFASNLITGVVVTIIVAVVVLGGIKRIGKVTGRLVPLMVVVYVVSVLYILFSNFGQIAPCFTLIFSDAFSGNSVLGGALGSLIIVGVRRAAFSNEAGIGTAPMAHGAAKTNEPVREGLVAMLGPIIDTIIICTMTALAIIITGVWNETDVSGISLTAKAFERAIPFVGQYILTICVSVFALTTLFSFPYYGAKCFAFVFGAQYKKIYIYLYVFTICIGAVATLNTVISVIDGMFAMMAIPTMISTVILAPKVKKAYQEYFRKLKANKD